MAEGEKKEQEMENLSENTMKNFPNLAKKVPESVDFQEVQEAQSPKEVGPKVHHKYITQD